MTQPKATNSEDHESWVVRLEVASRISPTKLAILIHMVPQITDVRVISAKKGASRG